MKRYVKSQYGWNVKHYRWSIHTTIDQFVTMPTNTLLYVVLSRMEVLMQNFPLSFIILSFQF